MDCGTRVPPGLVVHFYHCLEVLRFVMCVCMRVRVFVWTCVRGWISQKRLEIEAQFQWITNRKWHMANRLVKWPMTSRNPERSRSWPRYVWGWISWKRLEIETRLRCIGNGMANQMVMTSMTSHDLLRAGGVGFSTFSSLYMYLCVPLCSDLNNTLVYRLVCISMLLAYFPAISWILTHLSPVGLLVVFTI